MGYFTLLPIAKLETDNNMASIIDLLSFTRINYNKEQTNELLEVINKEIANIEELNEEKKLIVKELLEKGLAYLYEAKIANDEHKDKRDLEIRGFAEEIPHFTKIFFEITDKCDKMCEFCNNKHIIDAACNSCIRWMRAGNVKRSDFNYEKVIKRVSSLWVDEIVISGGNPLKNGKILIDYILNIRKYMVNTPIVLYTNGYLIDDVWLDFFCENHVSLNLMILEQDCYNEKKEVVLNDTIKMCIEKCCKKGIKYYFTILCYDMDEIEKIEEKIGIELQGAVFYNEMNKMQRFEERKVNVNSNYFLNQRYNSCLNNKLAITMDGFLRPCPMIADDMVDLEVQEIDEIFQNSKIDKYWRFTKSDVSMCADCPYKYSCEDCTAIELAINAGSIKRHRLCDKDI